MSRRTIPCENDRNFCIEYDDGSILWQNLVDVKFDDATRPIAKILGQQTAQPRSKLTGINGANSALISSGVAFCTDPRLAPFKESTKMSFLEGLGQFSPADLDAVRRQLNKENSTQSTGS